MAHAHKLRELEERACEPEVRALELAPSHYGMLLGSNMFSLESRKAFLEYCDMDAADMLERYTDSGVRAGALRLRDLVAKARLSLLPLPPESLALVPVPIRRVFDAMRGGRQYERDVNGRLQEALDPSDPAVGLDLCIAFGEWELFGVPPRGPND